MISLRVLLVLFLFVAHLPAQLGTVRVVNRTPYRHRNLTFCGVTFPPGAVLASSDGQTCTTRNGETIGVPGAVASAVQPFGARWTDGSVRFGRLFAVLEAAARSDSELPLGPVADDPYKMSRWMTAKAGRIFPSILLTRTGGAQQIAEFASNGRAELLAINRAALVVRFRNRIAATPLIWEVTFAFGSDTDAVQWWLWVHNSDPTVPDTRFDFDSIEFRTFQASTVYLREKLGIPEARLTPGDPGTNGTSWRVMGRDWIGDAQGLNWFEGVTPMLDVADLDVPDVQKRSEAQQAVVTGPLEMMHSGWSTPGLYGPLGSPGELPTGATVAQTDAALTATADSWLNDRRPIATWGELSWGEFSDTARTGAHPTHGVTRLADVVLTKNPRALAERKLAWLGEVRRPNCRFEADLNPVLKSRHPQWIAWSGGTHWVSQDKLGKPTAPQSIDVHTWSGPDPEHWMGETMLAPLALITADWRLLELGRHRMENLKGHRNSDLGGFAARAICWSSRAAGWWVLALGDAGDAQWTRSWLDYVITQTNTRWQNNSGPIKPWVTMVDRRYFASPEREFWIIWQHQFLFGWLEAARAVDHLPAIAEAARISRLCDLEGWDPVSNRPFGGQAVKPDAQPLTAAEKALYVRDVQVGGQWVKTDGWVTSSSGTDWDIWAMASLDIGSYFATAANDATWVTRNAQLMAAVRATLTDTLRKTKAADWTGAKPVNPVPVH